MLNKLRHKSKAKKISWAIGSQRLPNQKTSCWGCSSHLSREGFLKEACRPTSMGLANSAKHTQSKGAWTLTTAQSKQVIVETQELETK